MRRVDKAVAVMVRFLPGEDPRPLAFSHAGAVYRVGRVLRREWSGNFRLPGWSYLVDHGGRLAELFWDTDRHTWILRKLET